jgi:hypothetical protein
VSLPYLEDEIEILIKHEVLNKVGKKYQTNIIIFTEKADREVLAEIKPLVESTAVKFYNEIVSVLMKSIDFDNEMLLKYINEGYIINNAGVLEPNFTIMPFEVYSNKLFGLLEPAADIVSECCNKIINTAAKIVKSYAPKALKDKCDVLAEVRYKMDTMAFIMESLVEQKLLLLPEKDEKPCIIGFYK